MDYLKACENLPPKPRFEVGQQVRIVGPSVGGCTKRTGEEVEIESVSVIMTMEVTKSNNDRGHIYPASSLAPVAEVPEPRFKRGDKVVYSSWPEKVMVLDQIKYKDGLWFWKCPFSRSDLWYSESTLAAHAEPVYLPTRWISVCRRPDVDGDYDSGFASSEYIPPLPGDAHTYDHTHILHDMPRDKNGVQVDFVTLTEAGYNVHGGAESDTGFWINFKESSLSMESYPTAIDAWRAAGRHYLESKGGK
jgi:hypothetical protein